MRKLLGVILALGCLGLWGVAERAQAASITLDLDFLLSGGSISPTSSWGTLYLSDDRGDGRIDIVVDLQNPSSAADRLRVQQIYLNYDDARFNRSQYSFSTMGGLTVQDQENAISVPGGSNALLFDLQDPRSGNLGFEPYSDTLQAFYSGSFFALSLADFYPQLDTSGQLYAAVHIGSVDVGPFAGAGSLTVGAGQVQPVPEPAALVLLGTGLLGLAGVSRRRKT